MSATVVPFRRRGAPVTPLLVPVQRTVVESQREQLAALRAIPATPVYCRHPDCRVTVSVPHPLQPGYLHGAVCPAHQDTTADRYPHGWGLPEFDGDPA